MLPIKIKVVLGATGAIALTVGSCVVYGVRLYNKVTTKQYLEKQSKYGVADEDFINHVILATPNIADSARIIASYYERIDSVKSAIGTRELNEAIDILESFKKDYMEQK